MQNKWIPLLVSIVISFGSSVAFADAVSPESDLISMLENIKTLEANFTQKIVDSHDLSVSNSEGQMMVNRPNQFLWKSEIPDPIQVIADGKFLWTYDIDLAQVTKQNLESALQNSPASFLAGSASELKKYYHVSYAKQGECQKGVDRCFELKPLQNESSFANIILGFTQQKLSEMRLRDTLGQNVLTLFTHVKINQPLNPQLFSFKPPKGVDVISPEK